MSLSINNNEYVAMAEAFYKKHFGAAKVEKVSLAKLEKIPEEVRKLDAQIYAHKLYPNDSEFAKKLADKMKEDMHLHSFLRHNYFHIKLATFRKNRNQIQEQRPIWEPPELKIIDGSVQLKVNGQYIEWNDFKMRLVEDGQTMS